jgi:4-carboxymuconolactone decarboxylase
MAAVQAGKEKIMDDLKGEVAPNSRVTEEVTMTQDERPSGASTKQCVFGDQKKAPGDPFLAPFFETAVEHVWGGVWNRPGLELKYRSLVVVSVLAAIGQNEELKTHLRGALNLGWTVDELREGLLQISGYAGFPAAHEALRVLSEIVTQR